MEIEEKMAQAFADGTLELLRLTLVEHGHLYGQSLEQASKLQKEIANQTLRIHVATVLAVIDFNEEKTIDELTEIYRDALIETRQNYLTNAAAEGLAGALGR